ncbi:MAG TPA: helix-turn-helix domain-containing protein [Longimicrobiaceae bacterium]|nr:helix-turn-helix domain-containing protein [Longimicrobiaceae bacterium]
MRTSLRPLVLLHSDPALRERVRRVSQGRFELRRVERWDELERAVRETAPSGLAVVDPYHGQPPRGRTAPELYSLLKRFPSSSMVAALFMRPGWMEDVRALGERGIAGVIDLEAENTDLLILRAIQGAQTRPLRTFFRAGLRRSLTGRGRMIVDAAVDVVIAGRQAADLARDLRIHRDTLLRWCREADLPVPRELLMWLRVLLAAELLDNPGQTVENVAVACGYSCDDALARALQRRLGMRPTALRRRGAFRTAAARFQAAMEQPSGAAPLRLRAVSRAPSTRVA